MASDIRQPPPQPPVNVFPFDQSSLPHITARRAFIGVDFQNDFVTEKGALPVSEPSDYVRRAVKLATIFRQKGEVIWVKSLQNEPRSVDAEPIIVSDISMDSGTRSRPSAEVGLRYARRKGIPVIDAEGADGTPDVEAFLSHDRPESLDPASPLACEMPAAITNTMQKSDMTILKSHYSAFKNTTLLRLLRAKMVMEVFICGSLTNVGVYATAMDAAGHGLTITIVEDCCGYRSESRQRQAIRNLIEFTGCEVASCDEVLESIMPRQALSRPPVVSEASQQEQSLLSRIKRADTTPDIVHPLTELRLKSDSPNPTVPNVARQEISVSPGRSSDGVIPSQRELGGSKSLQTQPSKWTETVYSEAKPRLQILKLSQQIQGDPVEVLEALEAPEATQLEETPIYETSATKTAFISQKGLCEGDTDVIENLLSPELENGIFDKLREEIDWQHMSHQGGEVPRLVAVQGEIAQDGSVPVYRHPSDESPPFLPFSPTVLAIKAATEEHLGHSLNHVLIQYYRNGKDYISEHSDKTLDIAKYSYIANVSLGAERMMVLRTKRLDKDPSFRKDSSPKETSEAGVARQVVRASLPHNSLCRMGLRTNMKWLHSIRQDKRADREKTPSELAFQGGRISLTFRKIGTFLSQDETIIWGQGARSKTQMNGNPVINGPGPEVVAMLKAFGAENRSSDFDWNQCYGKGFDVLHMSNSPRFFASQNLEVNMRITLMMAELGITYSKGSMGSDIHLESDYASGYLPIRFVDNDPANTTVDGDLAIMMYLDTSRRPMEEGVNTKEELGRIYSLFQKSLELSQALSRIHETVEDSESKVKAVRGQLAVWNDLAGSIGVGFIAGLKPSLPDCCLWAAVNGVRKKYGPEVLSGLDDLQSYYSKFGERDSVGKVCGHA